MVPVGPGRAVETPVPGGARDNVIGYPVQPAKVQRPPLREETLARDRLLDWLNVKINSRVVVITAEAGYGKTTLLADFSRRTRHRTLWYRLDDEDRNWVAFLSYLVAAGREHDPAFAPQTYSLLRETGATGPSPDAVIETFVREFQALGELGAVLIFDDYHVVDDAPDVRQIVGQLLSRAPERVTFVFSTRRRPSIKVARLRGRGEVAELTTDDLRFSEAETEQLFRETYRRPLEPDVLDDLSRRTEGWAASLQLVQAALRDRSASQIRTFVRNLSGAEGDLYDYFAEEVVGDLDESLQDFLMKTSILETVEPDLAEVATGGSSAEVKAHIDSAEALGLLSRRSEGSRQVRRFHPLVREFLQDRLTRSIGEPDVRDLHRKVADSANARGDWRMACGHLASAGDISTLERVLADAVQQIMGSGQYALASSLLDQYAATGTHPTFDIVRSRIAFARGDWEEANALALKAVNAAPRSDDAKMNRVSLAFVTGHVELASALAQDLAKSGTDSLQRRMALAMVEAARASLDGDLVSAAEKFEHLARELGSLGRIHQQGISLLNAAEMRHAVGDAERVLALATRAVDCLEGSAAGAEAASARMLRAWAHAHLNDWPGAIRDIASIDVVAIPSIRAECEISAAEIHASYGDPQEARRFLARAESVARRVPDLNMGWHLAAALTALRLGRLDDARSDVEVADTDQLSQWAGRVLAVRTAKVAIRLQEQRLGDEELAAALDLATRQRSTLFHDQLLFLRALADEPSRLDDAIAECIQSGHACLTIHASLLSSRLHQLAPATIAAIRNEARDRPLPWRASLRIQVDDKQSDARLQAAALLDVVGSEEDIPRLRSVAKAHRAAADLGKGLARSLAPPVLVEDLGRVRIVTGGRVIQGTSVRRKVLACLVFLGSQPELAATRDQVLDALWPDLSPEVAVNSLNQTIYFLRRVFEPAYKEDLSPEYVHHDSDLLWLDPELVSSRSAQCWSLLRSLPAAANPQDVQRLCELYSGRFALDFAYEEWAVAYRDALHAAFLQVVETAVADDLQTGHLDRGVSVARRALEIDPEAEHVELSLLRLYRRSGAHAAAAEQYAHYSTMLRAELGLEPPPLDSL